MSHLIICQVVHFKLETALPVLQIAADGEVRISDVVQRLADKFELSEDELLQLLPSGRQRTFANRVNWAKSYLSKAGLVEITKRAHFRITPDGSKVLASPPKRIDIKYLYKFPAFQIFFQKYRPIGNSNEKVEAELSLDTGVAQKLTPDEAMRIEHKKIEDALGQELLARIKSSPPAFLERLIVNLLLKMGFGGLGSDMGVVLGGRGDGGVDGVIHQDGLGLNRIYIQAKRYDDNIDPKQIREFAGALGAQRVQNGVS